MFTNYIDKILKFFDHLPTLPLTLGKEFFYCYKGKCTHCWHFQYWLPTSSCQRSLWTIPKVLTLKRLNSVTLINLFFNHIIWWQNQAHLWLLKFVGNNLPPLVGIGLRWLPKLGGDLSPDCKVLYDKYLKMSSITGL